MIGRSLTLVVTQGQPIPDIPHVIRLFGQGRWVQLPLPIDFAGCVELGIAGRSAGLVSDPEHRLGGRARLCGRAGS